LDSGHQLIIACSFYTLNIPVGGCAQRFAFSRRRAERSEAKPVGWKRMLGGVSSRPLTDATTASDLRVSEVAEGNLVKMQA